MILKFTLLGLVLVLVVVIAVSYHVNKEGFDDISNGYYTKLSKDLGSAVNTIAPDVSTDTCLLYTSPSPRDRQKSRMPSSA